MSVMVVVMVVMVMVVVVMAVVVMVMVVMVMVVVVMMALGNGSLLLYCVALLVLEYSLLLLVEVHVCY